MTTDKPEVEELQDILRERLVGRRIMSVMDDGTVLKLNDGTTMRLFMSESDCCASAYGSWVVEPDKLDAMITDVRAVFDDERSGSDEEGCTTNYVTIKILHNQNPIALAECYADAGNGGYYYSILSIAITNVLGDWHDTTVEVVGA